MIWSFTPVMEYSVILLLSLIGVAAYLCILVPLRFLAARGSRTPGTKRYGIFFAATGLGYLAIEIAFLQKFGLFLGHPNYAMSVVLAVLLFTTGLGSLGSAMITRALKNVRFVSYALSLLIFIEYFLLLPRLQEWIGLPLSARIAIVFVLVAPVGLCLGVFVPTALERLKPTAPEYVPWAWGINGIFSVVAPILSVAFSISWGISALLLSAVPIYVAAGLALPALVEDAQPDLVTQPSEGTATI